MHAVSQMVAKVTRRVPPKAHAADHFVFEIEPMFVEYLGEDLPSKAASSVRLSTSLPAARTLREGDVVRLHGRAHFIRHEDDVERYTIELAPQTLSRVSTECPELKEGKSLFGREQEPEHWFDVGVLENVRLEFSPINGEMSGVHCGPYSLFIDAGDSHGIFFEGIAVEGKERLVVSLEAALREFALCIKDGARPKKAE